MTAMNRAMVIAGTVTLFQACGQIFFTTLALLQYFCVIDFLIELPLLIFIKILYFHNPATCGFSVNVGQAIDGMASQALVLVTREPLPTTRTLYINAVSLGLAIVWMLTCFGIMRGGAIKKESKPIRWPWLTVTVIVCGVDLVATVIFINDSFHTRTLADLVDYAGGVLSGAGNISVDTAWASWVMVLIYSRFVGLFVVNTFLVVTVVLHVSQERRVENTGVQVEAQTATTDTGTTADLDGDSSSSSEGAPAAIPRPGLSHSFRRMKERLFRWNSSPDRARNIAHVETGPDSLDASPERSPRHRADIDRKRTVNFPVNLVSLPQRLENMIAEQRSRLDRAVVDTSGRLSPPRASQSLPHLGGTDSRGRRGTAGELQGQLPWAYVPASAQLVRDQLPSDEDLPPVPLPDYTVIPSARKASVHRAASSLSSLTQKRDDLRAQLQRPTLTSSDVLY